MISLQTLHKHQLPECFESMSVDLSFLGEFMPDAIAIGIAAGTLDPVTHVRFFFFLFIYICMWGLMSLLIMHRFHFLKRRSVWIDL